MEGIQRTPRRQGVSNLPLQHTQPHFLPAASSMQGLGGSAQVSGAGHDQDNRIPPPGLKVYQTKCRLCPWVSHWDIDYGALPAFIMELEDHRKDFHGAQEPAHDVPREMHEYNMATTPRIFPEGEDDRKTMMHPARYAGPAVDPAVHYKYMPMEVKDPYIWLDMRYVGVPSTHDPRIMKWVQNRASRKLSRLDMFSEENLKKNDRKNKLEWNDVGDLIPGENVIMCETVHGLMMAALNYVELIREHHPYEYGPRAIYRVIAARCCDTGVSAKLIRQFFSDCVEENAGRACRSLPSLDHSQCESKWINLSLTLAAPQPQVPADQQQQRDKQQYRDQNGRGRILGPAVGHVRPRQRGPGCLSAASGTHRLDAPTLG